MAQTLKALLLCVLVLCMPLCGKAADYAYITNQGAHTVSIVDLQQLKVVNTIAVGKAPVGVAVDNRNQLVYVSNVEGHSLSIDGFNVRR